MKPNTRQQLRTIKMLEALVDKKPCPAISLWQDQPELEKPVFTYADWRQYYKALWSELGAPFKIEVNPHYARGSKKVSITLRRVPSLWDDD